MDTAEAVSELTHAAAFLFGFGVGVVVVLRVLAHVQRTVRRRPPPDD